jgi:hypothetical protein
MLELADHTRLLAANLNCTRFNGSQRNCPSAEYEVPAIQAACIFSNFAFKGSLETPIC